MRYSLPKLGVKQLEKLSDISSDVGLISLASVVLPAVLDRLNTIMLVLGLITTIFFWIFSLWLRK